MDLKLRSRTVFVTGATSGIGRATALAYACEGARVAFSFARNPDRAETLATEIHQRGGEALAVRFDLASPETIDAAIAAIHGQFGPIDVLVANAVDLPPWRAFEETLLGDWLHDVAINFEGTIRVIGAALPDIKARAGRLVLVSSGSTSEGLPNGTAYLTAKSALEGFARSLAWEVGTHGVLVNTVAPGRVAVPTGDAADQAGRIRLAARIPNGRLSDPDDVARLIVWLGSFANTNMTGEVVREGSSNGRSSHIG